MLAPFSGPGKACQALLLRSNGTSLSLGNTSSPTPCGFNSISSIGFQLMTRISPDDGRFAPNPTTSFITTMASGGDFHWSDIIPLMWDISDIPVPPHHQMVWYQPLLDCSPTKSISPSQSQSFRYPPAHGQPSSTSHLLASTTS